MTAKTSVLLCLFISSLALADRAILITPTDHGDGQTQDHPCLQGSFYGRYGRPLQDVHITSSSCALSASSLKSSGVMAYLGDDQDMPLVWVQEDDIDDSLRRSSGEYNSFRLKMTTLSENLNEECAKHARSLGPRQGVASESDQLVMETKEKASTLYYLSGKSALLSVPASRLPILDTYLPRFASPTVLPSQALNVPVDSHAVDRLQTVLSNLKFNPAIADVISALDVGIMRKDVRWLTGEDERSGIKSRHSFSSGSKDAADWLQGEIEKSGAVCEQMYFAFGFAPNVVCRYPSTVNTTATTILSAHYDSRGSFGSTRAPGGDDDGSGTTHVLSVSRAIKSKRVSFRHKLELVLFAGEEQGLVGSRAYSQLLRKADANVTLHIQADMLAYRSPSEPLQMGLPDRIGLPEAAYLVANVSALYSPELVVGYTSACCSDHQSFHEQGFPATQVFERAGPIVDPMYHNTGDISNRTGYDLDQVVAIARVTMATILETTGFDIVPVSI